MAPSEQGYFETFLEGLEAGARYRYRIDGRGPFPDPASRWQPDGIHGPSTVVDPGAFDWTDPRWPGPSSDALVFYELHVGTFTPEGTFAAAGDRLPYLADLGITAVELMPVADFPGERNWGYDGAALFAPARCYGAPDDLRRFVDRAHRIGLSVFLDVVYNHFGPDGAYAFEFGPYSAPHSRRNPWGAGLNFDGPGSSGVRQFFIENARMWLHEYHIDGLRLDATFAIEDRSSRHFLAELTATLRAGFGTARRRIIVVAEDHRNLARLAQPEGQGGWGCDMVWSDDFHHEVRRALAGDSDGYFADFSGSAADLAATLAGGWYFSGQYSRFFGQRRGTDPVPLAPSQFVFFIQNHDQVGNRAFGDRLNHAIDPASYRMAAALLLLSPETPLIFMGQEWAAGSPFQYFTDHRPELGQRVSDGRRREFARFRAFRSPEARDRIPDPQAAETFHSSHLAWSELNREGHRQVRDLYRTLLGLRRRRPALIERSRDACSVETCGDSYLLLRRSSPDGDRLLAVFCIRGQGRLCLGDTKLGRLEHGATWRIVMTTEDARFATDPHPPEVTSASILFARPGAVLLEPVAGRHSPAGLRPERSARTQFPTATYRVQMRQGFRLRNALDITPYLDELGVSHVYVSPLMRARAGSTHGYDVCEPNRLDPDLGSSADFSALSDALTARGMGLIVDFVPNHMAADETENPWWRSVLRDGPGSPYSRFFDIDWTTPDEELRGRVLLPILGAPLKDVLMKGELRVELADGAFTLAYFDRNLPLKPTGYALLLAPALEALEQNAAEEIAELGAIRDMFSNPGRVDDAHRRLDALVTQSGAVRSALERVIRSPDASFLEALLKVQHYRLAHWRAALKRINYRRFFYIDDLVALRMERHEVFDRTHQLILEWIRNGSVDGIRLDHVDGLDDPTGYLWRLRQETGHRNTYIVVEKILKTNERLPVDWPIDGTTGYDFLNEVNGLFVDGTNAPGLCRVYRQFTGQATDFDQIAYESKALIVDQYMAGELTALGRELARALAGKSSAHAPTSAQLRPALRELVAHFPVYRTYARGEVLGDEDRRWLRTALARAARAQAPLRRGIFHVIRRALFDGRREGESDRAYQRRLRFRMRLQQYTSAVEAKGTEDTAFYRYFPLASLNEVGGHPEHFACSVAGFHEANARRRDCLPGTMLATATHDTKRGEDVRMRLNVLSELTDEWGDALWEWSRVNTPARHHLKGRPVPDPATEYHLYQTLVGSWIPGVARPSADYIERISAYMEKAVREAKRRTSWIAPSAPYERGLRRFIERILSGRSSDAFLERFLPFQRRVARLGVTNSLAQVVLKIASPGVTDVYQGTELWDLHLVDPDNRRPVDYEYRRKRLDQWRPLIEAAETGARRRDTLRAMLTSWEDGTIKFFILGAGLRLRRQFPEVFVDGEYTPLDVEGERADQIITFMRSRGDRRAVAVVPRLVSGTPGSRGDWPVGQDFWQDTRIVLPSPATHDVWRNTFTLDGVTAAENRPNGRCLRVSDVLAVLPVGLLWNDRPSVATGV